VRYRTKSSVDGLAGSEAAFLACSFWMVDNYVLQHRIDEARSLFENLLSLRNDVGLLAEEYDAREHRQMGNFPQAFSHLALVNSAHNLSAGTETGPAHDRSQTQPQR
jgi:GH15 family glucan-1,4-alpha-glucosidase